jgi:predicted CXXCH cytochrome family protein
MGALWVLLAGAGIALAQADRSRACAGCHREVLESHRRTGMGRSFSRPSAQNTPTPMRTFHHEASDSHFAMVERGGAYFQRRHQVDRAGREVNVMEKRVDYVMGSGNLARTYLHRTPSNTLVELPLGWYAEKGGYWAMNPGYDRPDHDGFRRQITYGCMFCHNAYPAIDKPGADPVYPGALPEGIDCERCHGPGARHVELAGRPASARDLVRAAIVNPARLPADRQFEICLSCHLETTSFPLPSAIQRFDRGPFSFRPGEALADFILTFDHEPGAGRGGKFEIVSSAYRLRQSACFVKSAGKLLCTTCHNPHDAPRGAAAAERYGAACRQCHGGPLSTGPHAGRDDCVGCHMPKRRTEDVIHASVTDHLIQRRMPDANLLDERAERRDSYRGEVVPYHPATLPGPEGELYLALAQVKQGSNRKAGIARLTAAITKHAPRRAEWYAELAEAHEIDGRLDQAARFRRDAVRLDPSAASWQRLGTTLRKAARHAEAVEALQRSTALAPTRALTWHELGLARQAQGRSADAVAAMQKAIALDPELREAHNNLGIIRFASGDSARAEAGFREAIRIDPGFADAHGNLANLLAAAGRIEEAEGEFQASIRLRPADAETRYNHAMLLGRSGRYDEAQRELEACLRADPSFADGRELLGDLLLARNQAAQAIPHYREAARLRPDSSRAWFGLGAALAATGQASEAIPHLRKAAAGPDAEVRQRSLEMLRNLGAGPP